MRDYTRAVYPLIDLWEGSHVCLYRYLQTCVCLCDTVYVLYVFVTMEKLTAAQQQSVKKMSDERLRLKLVAVGYEEDVVVAMERETMLSTYAEVLASGI